jgi:hypothetical protein
MPENYYLPSTNILFTVIPKTGCTSLKNYLFDIEQISRGQNPKNLGEVGLWLGIHGLPELQGLRITSRNLSKFDGALKILVLRNPYERILSAWLNKFLYAQGDYSIFSEHKQEIFTPVWFETVADLNVCFEAFLLRLAKDPDFLNSDAHWRPQSRFVSDAKAFDLVFETSSMSLLQGALAKIPGLTSLVKNRLVQKLNATRPALDGLIGNKAAWLLVDEIYSDDFQLLASAGLVNQMPPTPALLSEQQQSAILASEVPAIFSSRFAAEANLLEVIKSSRSWRWTEWLRRLSAPILRGR